MNRKSDNYSGIYKDMVEILGEEITLKIYENYKGQQVIKKTNIKEKVKSDMEENKNVL